MKTLLVCFVLTITSALHAETLKMAVITSEFDKNTTDYFIETSDNGEIHSMRYITTTPSGSITEDVSIPADRVIADGAVLVEREGREAVRIEVENFNVKTGGTIKLNYLYSGVTGTRHIKRLNLLLNNSIFRLFDAQKEVNSLYLKANWSRLFGIIGIYQIEASWQTPTL